MQNKIEIEIRDSLAEISEQQWNALNTEGNPFLRYPFLYGLESTGCLGEHNGWYPRYFFLWDNRTSDAPQLLAAVAAYIKTNSFGEFVFDWAWADAYERNNLDYYPKLVVSVPFTPATGPRILVRPDQPYEYTATLLANALRQFTVSQGFSSLHWLFLTKAQNQLLTSLTEPSPARSNQEQGKTDNTEPDNSEQSNHTETAISTHSLQAQYLQRINCQYHWHNKHYQSFEHFLEHCTAKRRKTIKRERRYARDANLTIERCLGESLSEEQWQTVHRLYQSTFDRKWGNPSLTLPFFQFMGQYFGKNTLIVLVYNPNNATPEQAIACSVMFIGDDTLYGRYWGCCEEHNSLHFEACYYQGIEYCIEQGITHFEPGAQGEHKISRGFEPTLMHSAHYIAHPSFRVAIADFLTQETPHMKERCQDLKALLPFKLTLPDTATQPH